MQYYAAPMEGLTDRVWRQAQQKWFGPEGTAHRYYAPFLSPPENRVLIKKKMAELAPAAKTSFCRLKNDLISSILLALAVAIISDISIIQ